MFKRDLSTLAVSSAVQPACRTLAPAVLILVALGLLGRPAVAQSPVWSSDAVPKRFPPRNAVPAKASRATIYDNGHDSSWDEELRALARISDAQTEQDTGDPVGPTNGIVTHTEVDLVIPGRGIDFEFTRTYNSKLSDVNGPLGYGWDHCYNGSAVVSLGGARVTVNTGTSRGDVYDWAAPNSTVYKAPPGVYTLFKYVPPSTHVLRNREGSKVYFQSGLLAAMEDAAGNSITFHYDASSHLDYVVDTLGRTIDFECDITSGRLQYIQDFRGRRVEYYYDGSGNLSGVRSPVVTSTSGFNDFPSGRTERYEYLTAPGNLLDHKLAKIIRPNDVTQSVPPYGTPSVQFGYDTDSQSIFYGWCASQILGGTNAAGTAGGTITYSYTVLDYTTALNHPDALTVARLRGRVTSRKGNVTDYLVNQDGQVISVVDYDGSTPYTTTNEYNSDGELTRITQPRGNYTTIKYTSTSLLPHVHGNLSEITHFPGTWPSDQVSRTMAVEYEPIFNNVRSESDFRGNVTEYFTDYQEGDSSGTLDAVPTLQAELLNIFTRAQVEQFLSDSSTALLGGEVNNDGTRTQREGNVIAVVHPNVIIPAPGGAPLAALEGDVLQEALRTTTYNGYGQPTSETDEEENVTVFLYYPATDPDGDGTPTTPGTGLDPVTGGYLKREVVDTLLPYADTQLNGVTARTWDVGRDSGLEPTPSHKTTDYRYDPSGNVTSMVDPRGVKYEYSVNELDEMWKERRATDVSAAATRGGGIDGANETLTVPTHAGSELWRRDNNGNVVAHFIQHTGTWPDAVAVPAQSPPGNHFERYYTFDILDDVRTETVEYGLEGEIATWTYGYDANQNRTSVQLPEGNTRTYTWDFRDQMKTVTRGSGADQSTVTFFRDENGNLESYKDGRGKDTEMEYDGYDRVKRVVQPVGTEKKIDYDADSHAVQVSMWGHPGGPSPSGNDTSSNIEFQRLTYAYDERGRLTQTDRLDPQQALTDGALTPGDNKVTTVLNHDRLGRTLYVIDDDASNTERLYDGASRLIKETDPVENITETAYDDNDNAVKVIERDVYPNQSYRSFETFVVFDSLNRKKSSTDNIGRTERYEYDSRDALILYTDAVGTMSSEYINGRQVNNPGNDTHYKVDGLGRAIEETAVLGVGGIGGGDVDEPLYNPDGAVTRQFVYDGNGRLHFATDDSENVTEYQYDTVDRLYRIVYADTTTLSQTHDKNDNVLTWTDARGVDVTNGYDAQNRLTSVTVTDHATAVGTTELLFEYDGLSRLTKSTDDVDGPGGSAWVNEYTWDALSRPLTQKQNNRIVTSAWKEEAKKTSVGYPSAVSLQLDHDAIERVTAVHKATLTLADYEYAGRDRLLQTTDLADVVQRYHDGSWDDTQFYDGARRPTRVEFMKGGNLLTGVEHAFDRANNRLYARRLHDASRGDNYAYDSMYRLVVFERDVPSAAVGVPGGGAWETRLDYFLDGVHNRRKFTRDPGNGTIPVPTVITVDDTHNYVTKTRGNGPAYVVTQQTFDLNGNKTAFTTQGTHSVYKYDFLNRLRIMEKGSQRVDFDYDAEGKRVRTRVTGMSGYPASTEFVHDGDQVIEEIDGPSGVCLRRFYYGQGLDRPIGFENLAFHPGPGAYFYEQDSHGEVLAIHNVTGAVKERYTYGAFGSPRFETASNDPKSVEASEFGNPLLFQALRFESYFDELYYCRARFLDCLDGSFMQRDPTGIWGDPLNVGNPKSYCAANSANWRDPLGRNVYIIDRDLNVPGGAVLPSHVAVVVTPAGKAPGQAAGRGNDVSYGVYKNSNTGRADVHKNDRQDQGLENDGSVDDSFDAEEVPPPDGVSQEDWDKAVTEAAEDLMQQYGGATYKQHKNGKVSKKRVKGWAGRKYNAVLGVNCYDFREQVIRAARAKLAKRKPLVKA